MVFYGLKNNFLNSNINNSEKLKKIGFFTVSWFFQNQRFFFENWKIRKIIGKMTKNYGFFEISNFYWEFLLKNWTFLRIRIFFLDFDFIMSFLNSFTNKEVFRSFNYEFHEMFYKKFNFCKFELLWFFGLKTIFYSEKIILNVFSRYIKNKIPNIPPSTRLNWIFIFKSGCNRPLLSRYLPFSVSFPGFVALGGIASNLLAFSSVAGALCGGRGSSGKKLFF